MSPWEAERVASAMVSLNADATVEVAMAEDGTGFQITVEHVREAGPLAIVRTLRAIADALEQTAS